MDDNERLEHCYLGDGVYAENTAEFLVLRTGDHRDGKCDNKIYLEQDVLIHLLKWVTHIKKLDRPSVLRNFDLEYFYTILGETLGENGETAKTDQ
jgi:hypothetical protein